MLKEKLQKLNACHEAVKWINGNDDLQELWNTCERGDWMLWLIAKLDIDRRRLVLAACECARLSLKYVPKDEGRPLAAIEVAEDWAHGRATLNEVQVAAANAAASTAATANAAASAAAASAAAASAAAAANAVAAAAGFTDDDVTNADVVNAAVANAAVANAVAADVTVTVAANADVVVTAVAKSKVLGQCADIARRHFTFEEIYEAL